MSDRRVGGELGPTWVGLGSVQKFCVVKAKQSKKVKYTDIAVRGLTCHTAAGTRMPYRITQCYLPLDRGDIPAFSPAEAGTRISDPGGMQGRVDLVGLLHTKMAYPPEDGHPSKY